MDFKNININHFIILTILIFIIYFVLDKVQEKFENTTDTRVQKDKSCSQQSINSGFSDYIFSGVKSIR